MKNASPHLEAHTANKILFLDFDGVLHDSCDGQIALEAGEMKIVGKRLFQWAKHLDGLLANQNQLQVAVHSSWRNFHTDEELCALIGGHLSRLFSGSTERRLSRQESIEEFCQRRGNPSRLVLDDDASQFANGFEGLVLCDPAKGASCPIVLARVKLWLESGISGPVCP